jgi:serine/threonine protein kinase
MSASRVGELLANKYRLDKRLGSGGMGEVYRAENIAIGRVVAIKTLRAEFMTRPQIVARFLREARAANKVRHPNVVDVLDVGEDAEGVPFIVQEFLQGQDLARHFGDLGGRLAPRTALSILLPVIDAVAAAHRVGVVHRDLKLENVFLARVDTQIVPKVLDFGISRIADDSEDHRLTSTNVTMGTPMYMCPEALRGLRFTDARSDVWSLGVMLYELLAGAPPFEGDSQAGLFLAITSDTPAPLDSSVASPGLSSVIFRCLEKDPAHRHPDAAELAAALRALLDDDAGLTAVPMPPSSEAMARRFTPMGLSAVGPSAPVSTASGLRQTAETFDEDLLPMPPPLEPAPPGATSIEPSMDGAQGVASSVLQSASPPSTPAVELPVPPPDPPPPNAANGSADSVYSRPTEVLVPLARPTRAQEPAPVSRAHSPDFQAVGQTRPPPVAEPTLLSALLVPMAILALVLSLPIFALPLWFSVERLLREARVQGSLPVDGVAVGCVILAYLAKDWSMGAQTRHVAWDAFLAIFTLLGAAVGLFCAVHPGPLGAISAPALQTVELALPWCIALSAVLLGVHGIRGSFERSGDRRLEFSDALILCLCVPLVVAGGRVAFEVLRGPLVAPPPVESDDLVPIRRTSSGLGGERPAAPRN